MKVIRQMLKIVILISFLLLLILSVPGIVGFEAYAVTSGSMEPMLPVGALIWIKEKKDIQAGDVITFKLGESVITHRVEEILEPDQTYITKGDANENRDLRTVKKEQILGSVCFYIPCLGFAAMALGTPGGKIAAIALVLWILCLEAVTEDIEVLKNGKEHMKGEEKKMDISGSGPGNFLVDSRAYGSVHDGCAQDTEKYYYPGKY